MQLTEPALQEASPGNHARSGASPTAHSKRLPRRYRAGARTCKCPGACKPPLRPIPKLPIALPPSFRPLHGEKSSRAPAGSGGLSESPPARVQRAAVPPFDMFRCGESGPLLPPPPHHMFLQIPLRPIASRGLEGAAHNKALLPFSLPPAPGGIHPAGRSETARPVIEIEVSFASRRAKSTPALRRRAAAPGCLHFTSRMEGLVSMMATMILSM